MKVAIPRFEEQVAPCYEYSATIAIFTVEDGRVVEQVDFTLNSQDAFDRVRLLRDQGVDTLICGGVQDRFEDIIKAMNEPRSAWSSQHLIRTHGAMEEECRRRRSNLAAYRPPPGV